MPAMETGVKSRDPRTCPTSQPPSRGQNSSRIKLVGIWQCNDKGIVLLSPRLRSLWPLDLYCDSAITNETQIAGPKLFAPALSHVCQSSVLMTNIIATLFEARSGAELVFDLVRLRQSSRTTLMISSFVFLLASAVYSKQELR